MITDIKLLKNVGTFDSKSAATSFSLNRLTLISAENGRGKTTLAAVMRSLASGNPQPIEERWRFGADHPPHIVLECHDQPSCLQYQNGVWNKTLPELKIFDDAFVHDNVCSGLEVESQHGQNLHEFILGEKGVALSRKIKDLTDCISQHQSTLRELSSAISQEAPGNLSVNAFCALTKVSDIDDKIAAIDQELKAARNQEALQTTPLFEAIRLPEFDIEAIRQILLTDLPDLDKAAEAQVQAHVQALGEGGESWVEKGFEFEVAGGEGKCPFCGQGLDGLNLIDHYRAYFSKSYNKLKEAVDDIIQHIDQNHSEGAQLKFERAVEKATEARRFWETYAELPRIDIDTATIVQDWDAAKRTVSELLLSKQASPLEPFDLNDDVLKALETYSSHRQAIREINEKLLDSNEDLSKVQRQAEATEIEQHLDMLDSLKAAKTRFSDRMAPLCEEYIQETEAKACKEAEKSKVREALDDYRTNVFPAIQDGVNKYLRLFGADFQMKRFEPSNIGKGSGSTCNFDVEIENTKVPARNPSNAQGEPSFGTTLSAGDRSTLALALFFSSLDENPKLADTVVVIDDPISSLDDHRSRTTRQVIRGLTKRARQVILLSHDRGFLCDVWSRSDKEVCCTLEIRQSGASSTICTWDINQEMVTEHDQRYTLLQNYSETQSEDEKEVAKAIRLYLEGILRVICPGSFKSGALLGQFIGICKTKLGLSDEILSEDKIQELSDIVEYANQFHHDTYSATVNSRELLTYVERTLEFSRLARQ